MNKSAIIAVAGAAAAVVLGACSHYNQEYQEYVPILAFLPNEITVGSTVDTTTGGDLNPYGLAIAPVSSGPITKGDLIVCNFNDGATNTQGKGTTIVGLSPTAKTAPYTIAQSPLLMGCSEVVVLPDGNIVAAANTANDLVLVTPQGTPGNAKPGIVSRPYAADVFAGPWGLTYAPSASGPALYVSNSSNGAIDRISLTAGDSQSSFTEVVKGFSVNNGVPGSILAPAGLTYDPTIDALYVVDSNSNRVVSISSISNVGADGVVVNGSGFSGTSAASAHVIASGAPLNGPLSAALLFSGNLVVGNTLDPDGTNLMIEITPSSGIFGTRNVDVDQGGAIFGIATSGTDANSQQIFFNDDNDATVKVLSN